MDDPGAAEPGLLDSSKRPGGQAAVARTRPAWLIPTSIVLAAAGLLVSAYLSVEHLTDNATLACSVGGAFDCATVTTSEWSTFLGIPVAFLGLAFFVVALALCSPAVWRRGAAWLDRARLGWLTVGLAMGLYLVWAELFRIHAICLWCTAVHVVTFLLWVVVLFGQVLSGPPHVEASRSP
ncbi:MAG: vitamin K epoxide reductase family protein [Micrococcales bacterium]|nr:vitamin K epoxide reductase family protein [Micrococcales bacterium]